MTKANQNITIRQGQRYKISVPIVDSAGSPLTITGATIWYGIFEQQNDEWSEAKVVKSTTLAGDDQIAIVNIDGTDDGIEIIIAEDDIQDFYGENYYHVCRGIDASSNPSDFFDGSVDIEASPAKDKV
jgi:hypothetical protein